MSSRACVVLIVAMGCSYTSSYVPPDSSRVRPVWIGRSIVAVGPSVMPSCAGETGMELFAAAPDPGQGVQLLALFPELPEGDGDADSDGAPGIAAAAAVAIAVVVAATGLATTALGLALAPAGTRATNVVNIDRINEFNDELRRPTRCGMETP